MSGTDDDPQNDRTRIGPEPAPSQAPDDRTRISDIPAHTVLSSLRQTTGPAAESLPPQNQRPRSVSQPQADDRTMLAAELEASAPLSTRVVEPGVLINNNYRIQRMLSAGGMGEVYKAENVFTGDPVAVKIVLPSLASDDGIIQLFKREARILGQLNDSAIVRYHNFVLDQGLGRYCLIMEYIDGNTLWDQVDSFGPISSDAALNLIGRMAEGLGKAHARGVTHRDLSPDNVMLNGNRIENAVLIDFGIARAVDFGEGTLAGRFAGKFKYVSPEQLGHYGGEIGPAADIYGMALMIAAVVRGTALDMGTSAVEAVEARRGIPDLSGIPHDLYPLLQHMLEPDPAHRPGSMNDVAAMAADPTRIPVRYRLPLWHDRSTPPEGAALEQGRPLTVGHEHTSDSPFGPVPDPPPSAPEPPVSRRFGNFPRWAMVAAGGGVAVVALTLMALLMGGEDAAPPAPDVVATPDDGGEQLGPPPLPARDVATRTGFLADFDLPPCTLVQRIDSGMDTGKLAALSNTPHSFDQLLNAYDRNFGARPALVSNLVTTGQCPALGFVRELQGRAEPPPVLSLDSDQLTQGGSVAGRVRETQGRTIWLFLVAPDGGLHDLSSRLAPQADGSFTFSFGMAMPDQTEPSPQLVVALASRDPLVAVTTTASGAGSGPLLPRVRDEIAEGGGFGAADLAYFQLVPPQAAENDATEQNE